MIEKNTSFITISLVLFITAGMTLFDPVHACTFSNGEIEGIWQGTLKFSGIELQIVFTISRNPDKTLTASYDVPEQNATDVPVDEITFNNRNLRLKIILSKAFLKGNLQRIVQRSMGSGLKAV